VRFLGFGPAVMLAGIRHNEFKGITLKQYNLTHLLQIRVLWRN